MKWYRKAADQGYAPAQSLLGFIYVDGRGVPRDFDIAYMWFDLAAARGDEFGVKGRNDLILMMTLAQIAEGQRLARVWKPTQPGR
jgi:hypothetical protein